MMKAWVFFVMGIPSFAFGFGSEVAVHFSIRDENGNAVTNAEVRVRTRRDRLEYWTHAHTPMRDIMARTDVSGYTMVRFPCYSGDFNCFVRAPGFYSEEVSDISFKRRGDSVGYARLLEHAKEMVLVLRRKVNPIPMYVSPPYHDFNPPMRCGKFGFDLKRLDWVYPYGKGEVADFKLERTYSESNDHVRCVGAIVFDEPLCGAYRLKKMQSTEFRSVYEADTNMVYQQCFAYILDSPPTGAFTRKDLLREDEYLILRTRVRQDVRGRIVSSHYSKIDGPFFVGSMMRFECSFFNPVPNDPNLEYSGTNLAPYRR